MVSTRPSTHIRLGKTTSNSPEFRSILGNSLRSFSGAVSILITLCVPLSLSVASAVANEIFSQLKRVQNNDATKNMRVERTHFIKMADIRAIQVGIEAEISRFVRDDGESVKKWVERLRASDSLLGFKSCADPAPQDSDLASDVFFLAIQAPYQREVQKHGIVDMVLCIDGTHNTTQYYNCNLYTILGRDKWGHGE